MTKDKAVTIVLWLLLINLGIAFGAGLYETRIEEPQWLTTHESGQQTWNAQAARQADTGLRFWVFVTSGPLTLLTLLSLILVWKTENGVRKWWLIALVFILIDRSMTFGYFIPTMIDLMSGDLPNTKAVEVAQRWFFWNNIRHVASGLAFIFVIKTFSVLYFNKNS